MYFSLVYSISSIGSNFQEKNGKRKPFAAAALLPDVQNGRGNGQKMTSSAKYGSTYCTTTLKNLTAKIRYGSIYCTTNTHETTKRKSTEKNIRHL